ncbi:MAG: hypothetical protein R6U98_27215, partial [Pirellulaceae bacterium]
LLTPKTTLYITSEEATSEMSFLGLCNLLRRFDKLTDGCCRPPTMMRPGGEQGEKPCQGFPRRRCARVATVSRTINARGLAGGISRPRWERYRTPSMRE